MNRHRNLARDNGMGPPSVPATAEVSHQKQARTRKAVGPDQFQTGDMISAIG